jgi:quinoprotein glucose dehydrogenase
MWRKGGERRLFASAGNYLYALDPESGKPLAGFGQDGRIDLREGLNRDPDKISVALTTPGVIWRDTIIMGFRTAESAPAAPGDIRAFDVHTGKQRWASRIQASRAMTAGRRTIGRRAAAPMPGPAW